MAGHRREAGLGRRGVFSSRELAMAIERRWVQSDEPPREEQIQPASLDLRLGSPAYQLRASFLPHPESVRERLEQGDLARGSLGESDLVIDRIPLAHGATLQRGSVYLVPLQESLALPRGVRGRCNPKSTTGRLDIFTRVITDRAARFDEVRPGYRGPLYVEIAPQSFPVRVQSGTSLNQIRLSTGPTRVLDTPLERLYRQDPLLYDDGGRALPFEAARLAGGLCMSVDLSGQASGEVIGYRAHPNPPGVDLGKIGFYDPTEFWEPIRNPGRDRFILEANRFYILASWERIRVPPDLAAEMVVYDAGAGEIRTHYAGFFDPGFGFGDGSVRGTKVVMEVRAREVPFMVYHRQPLFKVSFERMMTRPERLYGEGIGSSYQHQTLTLSKHFRRG